jgi:TRAP-type C4-dicarboxylate transport system permease small subunit
MLPPVNAGDSPMRGPRVLETRRQRFFYMVVLPLAVLVNLGLGVAILAMLNPQSWVGWLQIATGAFCSLIAGWLAAAAWSKSYWTRNMARQVAVWRRISDTIFTWIEDAPMPAESLHRLKTSLDEAVPGSKL